MVQVQVTFLPTLSPPVHLGLSFFQLFSSSVCCCGTVSLTRGSICASFSLVQSLSLYGFIITILYKSLNT
jgi:hypothetical protein